MLNPFQSLLKRIQHFEYQQIYIMFYFLIVKLQLGSTNISKSVKAQSYKVTDCSHFFFSFGYYKLVGEFLINVYFCFSGHQQQIHEQNQYVLIQRLSQVIKIQNHILYKSEGQFQNAIGKELQFLTLAGLSFDLIALAKWRIKIVVIIFRQEYMSSIIDDLIFYRWKHQTAAQLQNQYSWQSLEQLSKNFTINQGAVLLNSNRNQFQTLNKLRLQKHDYSIRLKTQTKLKSVRVEVRLLHQNNFRIIDSKHNEILLLKEMTRKQFQANYVYPFCIHKGCVLMIQKMYCFLLGPIHQRKAIEFYNTLFAKNFKEFEQFICQQANYIYKGPSKKIDSKNNINQDLFLAQVLCNSAINFDVSDDHTNYQTLQQTIKDKKNQIRRVTKSIVQSTVIQQTTQNLFLQIPHQLEIYWVKDNIERRIEVCAKHFQKMLASGKFIGQKKIDDFIFNMVKITVKEIVSTPFNQGGSCQLFLAKAQMVFINSVDNTNYFKNNQKREKVIAIKKLKPELQKKYTHKLDHQKNIVSKLKGGASYFIPKYYRVEQQFERRDTLLMQFIQGDQLDYFIFCRQQSISLWTKICILLNIVNGMRHLASYSITHLDLKPINIIVCKNNFLISKIIDFGQAHHPQVCAENFSPGYTFPYVAPQTYIRYDKQNNKNNEKKQTFTFSEKQDVFSFGIIMFEVLFNARTFQFTQNKFKQVYSCKQILQRFLFTYERIQDYGEYIATSSLFYLITRCIDPDVEKRPRFDWLAIALRIILNSCSGTTTA